MCKYNSSIKFWNYEGIIFLFCSTHICHKREILSGGQLLQDFSTEFFWYCNLFLSEIQLINDQYENTFFKYEYFVESKPQYIVINPHYRI